MTSKEDILKAITFNDIINCKKITNEELTYDLNKLKEFNADTNCIKLCGNKFLYHFQMENLLSVKRPIHPLLKDIMNDEVLHNQFIKEVIRRKNKQSLVKSIFETYRVNRGSVVFFKPATAMYLYKKYNATHVLDPTAGWGGRMLGAHALDINYTGIDTNTDMKEAYDGMMKHMDNTKLKMIWESALTVDFSEIDYDFVLTSPPYVNIEHYQGMNLFKDNDEFYKEFLIPLIDKCRKHIKRNGKVAFNISPKMYNELLSYNYQLANEIINLPQKTDKSHKIYIYYN